ncbi:MAG: hypothetical protein AAGF49_09590 [Pseudomonadota bacterium]
MDIILHTPAPRVEDDRNNDEGAADETRVRDGAPDARPTEANGTTRSAKHRMADERHAHWCDVDQYLAASSAPGADDNKDAVADLDDEVRRWRFVLGRIGLWLTLWSERRTLAALDRRMLADIGVDEASALVEASRKAWDVPRGRKAQVRHDLYR